MPGDRMEKTGEIHLLCMCLVLCYQAECRSGVDELSNMSRHSLAVDGLMA